ncbi:putative RNA polymerase II mediator complex subunit Srb5 [Talaromyces proteolyticus]|uniref:Mediator of RNA polymerase II transcription subunit 18 n=1 Tax=Talaromyces proteolyticus TaxID=1131652 RepID=A0AAD4KNX2_9EURO|nr:putative RNA polymerase II mediator complex subunit Srb5 [Talaromyces proteolyticus]KAH8697177.1 putative RNA polymerase II mediator complex subunit Srb5 [Talaromyces proteolyticus]
MHELLLFASAPANQHHELLQQLAGLTAMQPRHRLERHLVFKATRKTGQINTRLGGGSQDVQGAELQRLTKMLTGATYYTQVVGVVNESDFGASTDTYDFDSQLWRMEWRDIPEAGTRSAVTSRLMSNAVLPHGDVVATMNSWGYEFVTEYVVEGDVFIHNDVVLFLHRVLNYSDEAPKTQQPQKMLPPFKDLTLLDRSGSYLLQTAVTVQDGSNPEMVKTATQHLFRLKEQLRTAVRLEQADRLSLDTRVK